MFGMIPLPYKLLAGFALIVGVYFYGYTKGSAQADTKIAEFSTKKSNQTTVLEQKNTDISNKVVIKYVDRVKTIREKEYVYRDIIKNNVPSQSIMSNGWVYAHDASALSSDADPARASDASPSGIADATALLTIVSNYAKCDSNSEQLKQLQKWIDDNKLAVNKMAEEEKKKK